MSGTSHSISWGVTTDDPERWTTAQRERYDWDQDAAVDALRQVMEDAGNRFINERPELFRSTSLA